VSRGWARRHRVISVLGRLRGSAAATSCVGILPVSHPFEGGLHGGHAAGGAAQSDKRSSSEAMTDSERAVTGRRDGRGSGG